MEQAAFLFTGCSYVAATGEAGGGWALVHAGRIAFGNVGWTGMDSIGAVEAAAARAGLAAAMDLHPEIRAVLLATDGNEVLFAPWGGIAEGMDPGLDATGLIGLARERGVTHAVRWWPGNRAGPAAPDYLMNVARGLAIQGRRGVPLSGDVAHAPGWRSGLSRSIGRGALNHSLKDPGLDRDAVAVLTGLDARRIDGLVDRRVLRTLPRGGVTLSSAIEVRDGAELAGETAWPADDFGVEFLAGLDAPPAMRLCVWASANGGRHAVGVSRIRDGVAEVLARRHPGVRDADPYKASVACVLREVTRAIEGHACPGAAEVVTTDPWIAKLLTGRQAATGPVSTALSGMLDASRARGVPIRPRLVRDALARGWRGNEPMALMALAAAATRVAVVTGGHEARAPSLLEGDAGLLPSVEALAARVSEDASREAQEAVTATLFDLVPGEGAARSRFEALATEIRAAYRGAGTILQPALPEPIDGRVVLSSEGGVMFCGSSYALPEGFAERWEAWGAAYAPIAAANPALRLREALLRVDPTADLGLWPGSRHAAVVRWISGLSEACPFPALSVARRPVLRGDLASLVAACGGWPFEARKDARAA